MGGKLVYFLAKIGLFYLTAYTGVSRMAYYRNYKSKDDILTDIFDDFMTKLTEISLPYMQTKQWYDYWKVLFDFFLSI